VRRFASVSSIIAAFGASLCCIGPFVLVALGFGAFAGAVSAFFEPLRPWLLAIAFGIVGWRLITLYRVPGDASCSHDSGSTCATSARKREMTLTWGVLAVVVLFAGTPHLLSLIPHLIEPAPAGLSITPIHETCLTIDGMSCSACATHLESELARVPGVSRANVNFDAAEACVFTRDNIRAERLIEAVARSGYRASLRNSTS
jgi:copper chaperone CopZ